MTVHNFSTQYNSTVTVLDFW